MSIYDFWLFYYYVVVEHISYVLKLFFKQFNIDFFDFDVLRNFKLVELSPIKGLPLNSIHISEPTKQKCTI